MLAAILVTALSALSAARAQSTYAQEVDIAGVQAGFEAASLSPSGMLPDFQPQAVIHAMFSGSESPLGFPRTTNQTIPFPYLTIEPAVNATDIFTQDSLFTLTMIDCDVVGTNLNGTLPRYWLVNDVALSSETSPHTVDYTGAAITDYNSPDPSAGSGPHRYALIMIAQPTNWTSPSAYRPHTPKVDFRLQDYIEDAGLGDVVAGFYFTVENLGEAGTQTPGFAISATTPVYSETLVGFGAASSSPTSVPSWTTRPTGSTRSSTVARTASVSTAPTNTGATVGAVKIRLDVVVGVALMVLGVVGGGSLLI